MTVSDAPSTAGALDDGRERPALNEALPLRREANCAREAGRLGIALEHESFRFEALEMLSDAVRAGDAKAPTHLTVRGREARAARVIVDELKQAALLFGGRVHGDFGVKRGRVAFRELRLIWGLSGARDRAENNMHERSGRRGGRSSQIPGGGRLINRKLNKGRAARVFPSARAGSPGLAEVARLHRVSLVFGTCIVTGPAVLSDNVPPPRTSAPPGLF